jgi:hypothetical protein
MKLQLSYDKKLVTLGLVNSSNDGQISVIAWYAQNLKSYDKCLEKLNMSLAKAPKGNLVELSFLNNNKTAMLVQKVAQDGTKHFQYTFFDVESGNIVYQVDNNPDSELHESSDEKKMNFIGLLVQE